MRQLLIILLVVGLFKVNKSIAQNDSLDFSKMKVIESQLSDVMEIIDTTKLKIKLKEVHKAYELDSTELNKVRLGIIYHEIALNLSFLNETAYKGYAKKSYDELTTLSKDATLTPELLPFVESYRASALSLVSAESRKLSKLNKAFDLFEDAVDKYSDISYLPEFLRGSVSENLPWFLFSKKRFAKKDFESIINKSSSNNEYANWKIMSFTYWAWANQHQEKKYRKQALSYLKKSIELDPHYKAGRKRAEELMKKLND